jgi:hypothetical protein
METNDNPKILLEKDGMKFVKLEKNKYNLSYSIENNTINLEKLINFELIKLIYELNPDIYEKVVLTKTDESQAKITLLMKHFFNDLGIPQKYSHMSLEKKFTDQGVNFVGASIFSEKPAYIPSDVELLPIKNLNIDCTVVSPHKVNFNCVILFHNVLIVPPFIEKIMGIIVNKVFNRLKQFIENVKL